MPWNKKNIAGDFPFLKITPALAAGIWLQWHYPLPVQSICIIAVAVLSAITVFLFLSSPKKFIYAWLRGILFMLLIICTGMLLTFYADIRNNENWFEKKYHGSESVSVTIKEPLTEKQKSWKALAEVQSLILPGGRTVNASGKILLYFKKEEAMPPLQYGSRIIITKKLQAIKNNGNPGALNYARVCLFSSITHQCFLSKNDYIILPETNINPFQSFIYSVRNVSLSIIKKYIPGKTEQGFAEALLIGYRNDLDRDLVQAYSNTGVVHIIAISGLHIGLIYGLLLFIFSRFCAKKIQVWIKAAVIICALWLFTLIAGAAPSILRATVMFTFLIAGDACGRKTNPLNSLASSACLLLIFNPFFLWDVGFQLSYAALAGIMVFHSKMYRSVFVKNKMLRIFWNMNAVTISAQLFTLPLVLYHFHQLPALFLLTNIIAVPLSFLVLYAELLLLCIAWWPQPAEIAGNVCGFLIRSMNSFVIYADSLPFSLIDGVKINRLQVLTLIAAIIFFCLWILYMNIRGLIYALAALCIFMSLRVYDIWMQCRSNKLIVYNVPGFTTMDFINGTSYCYAGDTAVMNNDFLRNFHLKYSRVKFRVYGHQQADIINIYNSIVDYGGKKIVFLSSMPAGRLASQKINVDIIIISGNPRFSISSLQQVFSFSTIIFDSSNSFWKISEWKKECNALHLRCHSVTVDDAFTVNF